MTNSRNMGGSMSIKTMSWDILSQLLIDKGYFESF